MIGIINCGLGNVGSLQNMLNFLNFPTKLVDHRSQLKNLNYCILPGVGHFDKGIEKLKKHDLFNPLLDRINNKSLFILGICLGAQMLMKYSEEGNSEGLGAFNAFVSKFNFKEFDDDEGLKIPHMGWSKVNCILDNLYFDNKEENRFYFVHSYHFKVFETTNILLTAKYGYEFPCALFNDQILALQFHPEKSHNFGLRFFRKYYSKFL